MYLGYNKVTKQYLRSLGGGGTITVSDSSGDLSATGFTMSGDINEWKRGDRIRRSEQQ